jgi:hypothetical protein
MGIVLDTSVLIAGERRGEGVQAIIQRVRRSADQQILERNADPKRRLLAFDASRQFCDFSCHRNHRHIAAQFLSKGPPSLTVSIGASTIDAVRQFYQGHHRERGILLSMRRQALHMNYAVVTLNVRHFQMIPSLSVVQARS